MYLFMEDLGAISLTVKDEEKILFALEQES